MKRNRQDIRNIITRAKDATWLASYRMGQPWAERVFAVKAAGLAPYRALACATAILNSYRKL